jgi:hypothetical protein
MFRRYQTDPIRGLTAAKAKANLGTKRDILTKKACEIIALASQIRPATIYLFLKSPFKYDF